MPTKTQRDVQDEEHPGAISRLLGRQSPVILPFSITLFHRAYSCVLELGELRRSVGDDLEAFR